MKEDKRADAVYEFAGMLTSMKKPVTFSGRHNAAPAADLVAEFLKKKGWETTFRWNHKKSRIRHRIEWWGLRLRLAIFGDTN